MGNLITLENVTLAFGLDLLLDHAKLQIASGERVCLIGRNGAGKSSLLKVIEGAIEPDGGTVWRRPELRVARLEQELPQTSELTVYEFVAEGLAEAGKLLAAYHHLTHHMAGTSAELKQLEKLQHQIDAINAWHFDQEMASILTRLALDPDQSVASLSGGWQRRAALARALVVSPDVLLLDEPTNHLDIEAIQWLEDFLLTSKVALVFITHDRALLQRLATRIIELDRGQLTSWPGDYQNFLTHKAELLHAEAREHAEFDKKLALEEKWIRQGIKARRTRNEGRVRALKAMRDERSKRREVEGKASFSVSDAEKSGRLVVEAKNITLQFDGNDIVKNFSLRIMRGDRIGLVGPNGVGKTSLINLLLGHIPPQTGEVKIGTKLEIAYFDQTRAKLDRNKTVAENVVEGSDIIELNGKSKHVIGYLSDFLFAPQRAMTSVKALSGGECNRLLLAKLFSRPSNLLIMDEPTNDLDIETLELLEEMLANYQGTLIIVSHDRAFLDNVVTSTLMFNGHGHIQEYVGGYNDYLEKVKAVAQPVVKKSPLKSKKTTEKQATKKLGFNEQQELSKLPLKIEQLEAEIAAQQELIADPQFYDRAPSEVAAELEKLTHLTATLDLAYQRWDELEQKS